MNGKGGKSVSHRVGNPIRYHGPEYRESGKMYLAMPHAMARDPKLTPNGARVAMAIFSNSDDWEISINSIAEQCNINRRTAQSGMDNLIVLRWVARQALGNNRYMLHINRHEPFTTIVHDGLNTYVRPTGAAKSSRTGLDNADVAVGPTANPALTPTAHRAPTPTAISAEESSTSPAVNHHSTSQQEQGSKHGTADKVATIRRNTISADDAETPERQWSGSNACKWYASSIGVDYESLMSSYLDGANRLAPAMELENGFKHYVREFDRSFIAA